MLYHYFLASLTTCLLPLVVCADYQEHLYLQPLPQSALLATFNFRSNTSLSAFEQQNYNLFPRSLGQILQHAHTKELHLRFSLGRWDAENWGARPRGGRREGGTGVELWAWVEADTDEEATSRWLTLTNALSGLFCASLNFIDSTKTIRPRLTFDLEGDFPDSDRLHLLHGALPHEVVCTENLTPFLKLLPCKGKAGISSLLDGHKLFDASWQSMAVDIRPICPAGSSDCALEFEQTVDMVLDVERAMRPAKDPIPRPPPMESISCNSSKSYHGQDTCFPELRLGERDWTLRNVFGTSLRGACPLGSLADLEHVPVVHLRAPADREITSGNDATLLTAAITDPSTRTYHLTPRQDFDLKVSSYPITPSTSLTIPLLHVDRTFTGHGQERGGVLAVLSNPSPTNDIKIVYLESLPWFMKPYLHTLRATSKPLQHTSNPDKNTTVSSSPITSIYYRPSIDRQRGTHLELTLTIPARTRVSLTYTFEKAILRYTEYPPDANRGFDVAPAIIRILPPSHNQQNANSNSSTEYERTRDASTYLRTTSLLLPLPTPDFSMPYNVIILTSTVIAMGFGSILNLLVRRFVAADEVEAGGLMAVVKEKVGGRVRMFAQRVAGMIKDRKGAGGEKKMQ